jgi:hypothetical protein
MVDSGLQRSLKMWKGFRRTPESERFADIISPFLTQVTLKTRQANLESNAVSNLEVGDFCTNVSDNT